MPTILSRPTPTKAPVVQPITVDPLRAESLGGLSTPEDLLKVFNRLQEEVGILNGALTLGNFSRLVVMDREFYTPSEWVPLTLENGFADNGGGIYGSVGVRKSADGRVELRERVARGAGPPAVFTTIATLPEGYAPVSGVRRSAVPSNAANAGSYDVLTTGAIRWIAGDPTTEFSFAGGSWVAADKSVPAWSTPLRLVLPVRYQVEVRHVLVVARQATFDGVALKVPCVVHSPVAERVRDQDQPELVIPRIDGLQPETRYKLGFWIFLD